MMWYNEIKDEVLDRLDNFTATQGASGEFIRQKKQSPQVVARAVTDGIIEFCRVISHISAPKLIQTVELQSEGITLSNMYAFAFPFEAMHERDDAGIISFIMNGEQVDFQSSIEYEQLVARSRLSIYTGAENMFSVDYQKRRVYTAKNDSVKALIFKRPNNIFTPSQNMFHGVKITGSDPSAITITDGIGGSVGSAGNNASMKQAINDSESFAYEADIVDNELILYVLPGTPLNSKLNPTISAGSFTITDIGTQKIPLSQHFKHEIVGLSVAVLIDESRRRPAAGIRTQPQTTTEGENE